MGDVGVLNFDITFVHEMIFTWLCLAAVSFTLYRLLYKPVGKILTDRREKIALELSEASKRLKNAEELKTAYEERLAEIEGERGDILDEAGRRAAERERLIIKTAKTEAKAIKTRALSDIASERENAREETRRQIIESSALMAQQIINASLDENIAFSIVEKSLSDLEGIEWPELQQ